MNNMSEKRSEMKQHCLDNLQHDHLYPGYPAGRFMESPDELTEFTIPDGPWTTDEHFPTEIDTSEFTSKALLVDQLGRPLHPWMHEISAAIGLIAGRGAYWNWGPNYTVDPVVVTDSDDPHILMVQRNDNGRWALPGGFQDPGESTIAACVRECAEETGVEIADPPLKTVYTGPVADARTTAHAWAYTDAKLWRPKNKQPTTPQLEEVAAAQWLPVSDLPPNLHGSHSKIIELALREL